VPRARGCGRLNTLLTIQKGRGVVGYISNQWLGRGQGLRNRSYHPVAVSISADRAVDNWSERNAINLEFTARRTNGEYQTVHLSQAEADAITPTIVACISRKRREELLLMLLRELSHARLLRVLALDLRKRMRLPRER
jgi:hypothetical protein